MAAPLCPVHNRQGGKFYFWFGHRLSEAEAQRGLPPERHTMPSRVLCFVFLGISQGSRMFPFSTDLALDARGMIRESTQCFLYNFGCEKGNFDTVNEMAEYVGGGAHQKILSWNFGQVLPKSAPREYNRFRIRVLVEGKFEGGGGVANVMWLLVFRMAIMSGLWGEAMLGETRYLLSHIFHTEDQQAISMTCML
jgi:hypothetical protein